MVSPAISISSQIVWGWEAPVARLSKLTGANALIIKHRLPASPWEGMPVYTRVWLLGGRGVATHAAPNLLLLLLLLQVNGGHLPEHIGPFCAGAAAVAAALPLLQLLLKRLQQQQQLQSQPPNTPAGRPASGSVLRQAAGRLWGTWSRRTAVDWCLALLPSGVGFAVGCYLTPNWTVPRLLGSVFEQVWLLAAPESHAAFMMVTASGLVLGEGCASVVTAVLQATARKST